MSDYGTSKHNSYNAGMLYKANFDNSALISNVENTGDFLLDKKLGYTDNKTRKTINAYKRNKRG